MLGAAPMPEGEPKAAAPMPEGESKAERRRRKKLEKRQAAMVRELLGCLRIHAEEALAGKAAVSGGTAVAEADSDGAEGPVPGGRHVFVMPSHRIYAETLPSLSPWLAQLMGAHGAPAPPRLFPGWPFAVTSFEDAASAEAAAAATNGIACEVEGDRPTGGERARRTLMVLQAASTLKLSSLQALHAQAQGGGGDLSDAVPRFSLPEPAAEEDAIKLGIVGGSGLISAAIVQRLLAANENGSANYEIVLINRGSVPPPAGTRLLKLDRNCRTEFEETCAAEMFEYVIDMLCFSAEDARSSIRAFGSGNRSLRQFVFCSTADVYGTQLEWLPVCEDHPTRPVGRYGKGKLAAERVFQAEAVGRQEEQAGFPLTVIRPASVYGEAGASATLLDPLGRGDGEWVDEIKAGRPVVVAGTEGIQTQFLHADDCAFAFAGVLGQSHSIGKTYNVCAKEMHTWGDYYRAAMAVLGREVPIVAAPTALLVAAGAASIAIEDNFAHSRVLSPQRICRDVPSFRAGGSCGGVRLGEGLRRMIAAMESGALPRRGPAGVLTGAAGERRWASALTIAEHLTALCAGLSVAPRPANVGAERESGQGKPLRIGFCGAGKQAAVLAGSVLGFGAEVVGVCDRSPDAAQKFADKYGRDSGCTVAPDIQQLVTSGNLDGLVIATPPAVRLEPIQAAAEAGVPILLEKPPAISIAAALECLRVLQAHRHNRSCTVAFQLRLAPAVAKLRALIATRPVGCVRTVATVPMYHASAAQQYGPGGPRAWELQEEHTGGALPSQAIHILDAVRFVLGGAKLVRGSCLERGEQQMRFDGQEAGGEDGQIASVVQMVYELDGGTFCTHCNHCGVADWLWEMQVLGPDISLTLRVGIPTSSLIGSVDGNPVHELFDERPAAAGSAAAVEPKVAAWLRRLSVRDGTDAAETAGGLCDYADAVASLELALSVPVLE